MKSARSLDAVAADIDHLNQITWKGDIDELLIGLPSELYGILGDKCWLFLIDLVDEILQGNRSRGRSVEGALLCLERFYTCTNGFSAEVLQRCSTLIRNRKWPERHAKRLMRSLCDTNYYYREPEVYWEHCALCKWFAENYEFSFEERFTQQGIAGVEGWIRKRFLGLERLERNEIEIPAVTMNRIFTGPGHEAWLRNGFLLKNGAAFRELAAVSLQLGLAWPVKNADSADLWIIEAYAPPYKTVDYPKHPVSIGFVWKKEHEKRCLLIDAEIRTPGLSQYQYESELRDPQEL